ncbi:MAG: heme exporter protein CcmD [Betaproteobacteria bacterium]|nr:heme exporter protein CcmD [Betaproteobacteria bacterium]
MRWESWSAFWHMGGYAMYVWGSVGMCMASLALEVWWARRERTNTLRDLRAELAAQAAALEGEGT